jgi:hypothetical protein
MSVVVIGVRCHYCSKFRPPREVQNIGTGGAKICLNCVDWHEKALRMFAGNPPPGCQQCGLKFKDLKEFDAAGNLRMYVAQKDGIYQVLCESCNAKYIPKRADLFRDTAFGRLRGIG